MYLVFGINQREFIGSSWGVGMRGKASVTVYFSLIIMILLAVILTTVESARLAGIRVRCQSAASLGLESLFADYAAPLFEEYGLLFLEGSYGTGQKEAYLNRYQKYVSYNADCNYDGGYLGNDFYRSKITEAAAEMVIYATDKDGKALEEQVCAAVIGNLPQTFLEEILGRLELSNQCGLLTQFFNGINRISDQVSKVDKAVQKIYEKVEELKTFRKDFEEKVEDLRDLVERLDDAWESYQNADTEEEEEDAWDDVKYYRKKIENLRKKILEQQEQIQKTAKTAVEQEKIYKENTQKVMEKLIKLRQELLEEQEEEVREEIVEVVEKQIADIKHFSGGEGDYYQVEAAEIPLQSCKEILDETLQAIKSAKSNEDQLLSILEKQNDSLNKCGILQQEILFDNHYQGESGSGILQMMKELIDQGITGFVMKGKEISSAGLNNEGLPSVEYGKETGILDLFQNLLNADHLAGELLETGKNTLLTDEYVLQYFANVTQEQEHVLSYEAEYVLCGKLTDQKNLEETVEQMVVLRTGMNLIYLLSDTESCSQAQTVAMGIVGFTGMMGLVRVVQLLALAAWAYAEALLDVRNLVNGGSVAFLKKKADWKTGIFELGNLGEIANSVTKDAGGLSYRDYLHVLMIKENQSRKLYRMMDLIQVNLCQNGWDGFRMDQCIYALQMKTDFSADVLFLNISPFAFFGGEMEGYSVHTVHGKIY